MGDDVDEERARAGLATVRAMLGLPRAGTRPSDGRDGDGRVSETERMRRWRLVLGGGDADGTGADLRGDDRRIDGALGALYDRTARRGGGGRAGPAGWPARRRRSPAGSATSAATSRRRSCRCCSATPSSGSTCTSCCSSPSCSASCEPDLHLVTLLVELNRALPEETRATARQVVATVLAELEARLADRTRQAVRGALARSSRTGRPRPADIDWPRTIRANLRHWLPEHRTVVPERLVGYGRHQRSLARDVIIAVDQSGSMAGSVVHASLFACVLARLPTLRTSMVAFDTAVADLTPLLADPVDVLFGVQLGGGTDIGGALGYCRRLVTRPRDTVLLLVSDLFEGGNPGVMRTRVAELVRDGVTVRGAAGAVRRRRSGPRPPRGRGAGRARRDGARRAPPTSSPTSSLPRSSREDRLGPGP